MTNSNSGDFSNRAAGIEDIYQREALLKVGNYKKSVFEAIFEAKDYITRNDCKFLSIDVSGLNMIDAIKVCVLSSTYHFAKYCGGKIKWFVKDNITKNQIEQLRLDNTEVEIKKIRKNYAGEETDGKRNFYICK